jgi:hypothetical protein
MMMAARSSYVAWVSRGSWPKRPKAHGAAVDVGNREKEDTAKLEDEDISFFRVCGGDWRVNGGATFGLGGGSGGEKVRPGEGHASLMAYICSLEDG